MRAVGSDGDWATIVWSDLDASTADLAIPEQVARFAPLGRDFEWKLYSHDRPVDLGQRLVAAGFRPEAEEALLVADAAELSTEVALPEGVQLLPVTDARGVRLVVRAHEAAFGTDHSSMERRLLTQLAEEPEAMAAVVAMAGDVPICAGRVEFHRGTQFASLWGGGTAPAWRARGVYRALVACRARLAVERGYRYLQVDALPDSQPILSRLGFVRLEHDCPIPLRAVGGGRQVRWWPSGPKDRYAFRAGFTRRSKRCSSRSDAGAGGRASQAGDVALDGTKVHANDSRHSALSYEHESELEAQLKAEVGELMALAEAAHSADVPDGMSVPEERARREERLARIAAVKAKIDARAKERFAREQEEHEAKMRARAAKTNTTGRKPGGRPPQPPKPGNGPKDQVNQNDED